MYSHVLVSTYTINAGEAISWVHVCTCISLSLPLPPPLLSPPSSSPLLLAHLRRSFLQQDACALCRSSSVMSSLSVRVCVAMSPLRRNSGSPENASVKELRVIYTCIYIYEINIT